MHPTPALIAYRAHKTRLRGPLAAQEPKVLVAVLLGQGGRADAWVRGHFGHEGGATR